MADQKPQHQDIDPIETQEWLDAMRQVIAEDGAERACFIIEQVLREAQQHHVSTKGLFNTPYINTIATSAEPAYPGDLAIENQLNAYLRWNAMATVVRAGKKFPELGGHIATYASALTLYEVGFNHCFHAPNNEHGGDLLYIQGHASPGIYARAYLEGRISDQQMENFRQEVGGQGIPSYPHPWLYPDFWQFATVSMGLGPLMAVYQARFLKYLENRGLAKTSGRKVWAFCGDGEMDEPESISGLSIAARENLDNLIFVVNCNLQRLDGPVRGNGKIIQELERIFSGAGWNVIKVLWNSEWDSLFESPEGSLLERRVNEVVDGEWQNYVTKGSEYLREHLFGVNDKLKALVANKSDEELSKLQRGGHDPQKMYAAYQQAMQHQGQPTVILAHTVKGYGMGEAGEALNTAHQQKKMNVEALKQFRDRFDIPVSDKEIEKVPFIKPDKKSELNDYLVNRRNDLGGYLPSRRIESASMSIEDKEKLNTLYQGTGEREISTTMAFVRIINTLLKDKNLKDYIVPIIPDECRTFGMEGLFRQIGIYSPHGQQYTPVDAKQVMYYREDVKGQILEEGLNEAGAVCSWIAAATSYSVSDRPMIPFYIYYSMFGFQRIGDFAWAAGDMQARGFLLGATSGRTTLSGEGLQHLDGHSHILASTIPNCVAYDPTYAYELAVIIQDGIKRMYEKQESVFYYITLMNENYTHPEMPKGVEDGIIKGMYLLQKSKAKTNGKRVQLLGSGTILREVLKAQDMLSNDFKIAADVWSVTSFNELRRDGLTVERENRLHPNKKPKQSFVEHCLGKTKGPIIAATDYMKSYADQIRFLIDGSYTVLGTDGYGRSDTRDALRHFFEVDAKAIAYAAIYALSEENAFPKDKLEDAMKTLGIDSNKPNPATI